MERRFLVAEGIVAFSLLAAWRSQSYPLVLAIGAVLIAVVILETLLDRGRDEGAEHADRVSSAPIAAGTTRGTAER